MDKKSKEDFEDYKKNNGFETIKENIDNEKIIIKEKSEEKKEFDIQNIIIIVLSIVLVVLIIFAIFK